MVYILSLCTFQPRLCRKRWICDNVVKCLELVVIFELRVINRVSLLDVSIDLIMENHIHFCQANGCIVFLLTIDGRSIWSLTYSTQKQRPRATSRVIDSCLFPISGIAQSDDFGHHTTDLCRCVELTLTFTALGGEIFH